MRSYILILVLSAAATITAAPTLTSLITLTPRAERLVCPEGREDLLEDLGPNQNNPFAQEWLDFEMRNRERDELCKMEEYCKDSKSNGLCTAMCSLGCGGTNSGDQSCQGNCGDDCSKF